MTVPIASERAGSFKEVRDGLASYLAFHPAPLPPVPPLDLDVELHRLLDRANQALGRLDGITLLLPDPSQFLYTFIRKEAVLSSQIEGTVSSLSDLLLFENEATPGVPVEDLEETANYIAAMSHGVDSIASSRLPLCNRLLREVHERLLQSGRGSDKAPGEFRRSQNWLGGTRPGNARYVPPPWPEVEPAMSGLERFLHDLPTPSPVLVKAALSHVQFEIIHPFLDGNGRVGRLLITLLLVDQGVLKRPLLYLSLYLKRNRDAYYEHLQRVRTEGAWEDWLRFFLEGVVDVAESTTDTTRGIIEMIERDRERIHEFGRAAATALRVHDLAVKRVVVKPPNAAEALELSEPPVYAAISRLEDAGILREVTGRARGKTYVYGEYMDILNEGTEV
ncbi:MAG TPA: Fic family protein [Solirubrobacterales bacterium]|nr:Fic family protein [Solirubrobacterales bacterium]